MANLLDEDRDSVREEGRGIGVIDKKIAIEVGVGSTIFEIILWICAIIPGLIFLLKKISAKNYFNALEQKLQSCASTVDNYLEQRVVILENAASIVNQAVTLDKDVMTRVSALRNGVNLNDSTRSAVQETLDATANSIRVAFEQYPDLKAHAALASAMQQNNTLQKEVTAAREVYNSAINQWNRDIQIWPTKRIVAAKQGFTTRIPFAASSEMKARANSNFFQST